MNRLPNHIGRNTFTHTADCHKKGGIMNPKIPKLREKLIRLDEKMSELINQRNACEAELIELENTDIIGIVREYNIGIEELSEFVKRIKERSAASEEN